MKKEYKVLIAVLVVLLVASLVVTVIVIANKKPVPDLLDRDDYTIQSIDYLNYDYQDEQGVRYFEVRIVFSDKTVYDGYAVVALNNCTEETITIPEKINDRYVLAVYGEMRGSDSIKTLIIPKNIIYIYGYTLSANANLENIVIDEENKVYKVVDNCVLEKQTNKLVVGCKESIIPEYVTQIGAGAFAGSKNITSIIVPDTVTLIEYGAFAGCSGLTEMTLPFVGRQKEASDMFDERTGCYVFGYIFGNISSDGCYPINQFYNIYANVKAEAYIPNSLKTINITGGRLYSGAFAYLNKVEEINVVTDSNTLPEYCFIYCRNLKDFNIPDNISTIGSKAFAYCSNMENVEFNSQLKIISSNAFFGCEKLNKVIFNDGLEEIGKYAFANCSSIESIDIPDSVTNILGNAFSSCKALKTVSLPTLKIAGSSIFSNCSLLQTVDLGKNTIVYNNMFYGCNNLKTVIGTNIIKIKSSAFENCVNLENISNISQLEEISDSAFENCQLININIPSTVKSIGREAFKNCTALTDIQLSNNLERLSSYAFYNCTGIQNITLGNKLEELYDGTFINCTNITSIVIPINVTKIGDSCFSGCERLENVSLPIHLKEIGYYAFKNCKSIQTLVLPEKIETIGEFALAGMESLEDLTIPFVGGNLYTESLAKNSYFGYIFGTEPIEGFKKLDQLKDDETVAYSFYIPSNLNKLTILNGKIREYSLSNLDTVTTLNISENVTSIENSALVNCNNNIYRTIDGITYLGNDTKSCLWIMDVVDKTLTEYIISVDVVGISSGAFKDCASALKIVFPSSCVYVGEGALSGCKSLEELTIPFVGKSENYVDNSYYSKLGYIFGSSEYDNSYQVTQKYSEDQVYTAYVPNNFKKVTIQGGTIGDNALEGFSSLEDINLLGVTKINNNAFLNCNNITSVSISDSVVEINESIFRGLSKLELIQIPFIGKNSQDNNTKSALLGYLFGEEEFENTTLTEQCYDVENYVGYYIPNSLKRVSLTSEIIPYGAFSNCKNIENVYLSDTISYIGYNAFLNCDLLSGNTYSGNTYLSSSTNPYIWLLKGANNSIHDNTIGILYEAFIDSNIEEIDSKNVKYIGDYAFKNSRQLKTVVLNNAVESIGKEILYGVNSIENITIPFVGSSINAENQDKLFNYLFKSEEDASLVKVESFYSSSSSKTTYVPSSLKQVTILSEDIPYGAFSNMSMIKSVNIPNVTTVKELAFLNCIGLNSTILTSASLTRIEKQAFKGCISFTDVVVSDIVEYIGEGAFNGCSNITSISLPFIGQDGLSNTTNYTTMFGHIFGTLNYDGAYQVKQSISDGTSKYFYLPEALEKVVINGKSVLNSAFSNCSKIKEIEFTMPIESIPAGLFLNCTSLTTFTYDKNCLKFINSNAFNMCTALVNIEIGGFVEDIARTAFRNCTGLVSITVDAANEYYCSVDGVLYNKDKSTLYIYPASKLGESFELIETLKTIDERAFELSVNLKTLILNEQLTNINTYAFRESSIEKIFVKNNLISSLSSNITNIYNINTIYIIEGKDSGNYINYTHKFDANTDQVGYLMYIKKSS